MNMTRPLAGLVAALLAGAWIGFIVEWSSESGGWHGTQEMHLAAAAAWAAGYVTFACCLVEAALWRRPEGWLVRLVATSLVGAALFVVQLLLIMGVVVAITAGLPRLGRWLVSPDLPGAPGRSIAER